MNDGLTDYKQRGIRIILPEDLRLRWYDHETKPEQKIVLESCRALAASTGRYVTVETTSGDELACAP